MKRIIVAPDSFKESLDAVSVTNAIATGFLRVYPGLDIIKIPMADGGEGLVQTLVAATKGKFVTSTVTGPLGEPVEAVWGVLGDGKTCVIEMAAASGLPLVPPADRNPFYTTTYGTGELIRHALGSNCTKIIIGVGGSATNDGGAGMAQAMGAQLLDASGKDIEFGANGVKELNRIDVHSMDDRLAGVKIVVAVDVKNPLCGPWGASHIYAGQKGATQEMLPKLDHILCHFAGIVQRDLHIDLLEIPGGGAAGGLGAGLIAFLDAEVCPGVDVVLDVVGMDQLLENDIDLVVTGEGEVNAQTAYGKVPVGVAKAAKKHQIPVVALVGSISEGASDVLECGVDAYFSVVPRPMTLHESMTLSESLLADLAEQCARMIKAMNVKGGCQD